MINGKKLTDTATKTGTGAPETASKGVVKKTAGADKSTSVGKSRNKEIYIPPEKRQQIIDDCFKHSMKIEYQKIRNLLGSTSDKVPRFIIKNR